MISTEPCSHRDLTRAGNASGPAVDIIVGGLWHAPQLAQGLLELGYSVRVITAQGVRIPGVEVVQLRWARLPMRATRGFRFGDAFVFRWFGSAARRWLRAEAKVIAWSSFGLSAARERPVIIVRGSMHARRQQDILRRTAAMAKIAVPTPNDRQVALERREYRAAACVVVPTEAIAADPLWAEDGACMAVVPWGFPTARPARPGEHAIRTAVFAGEVGLQKGIDRLAAALPAPCWGLEAVHLFGNPSAGFPVERLPEWWTLHGWVPPEVVGDAMRRAGVLILLSRSEAMARSGMEAMASGTPIVVTPETGLDVWVRDGGGAVVNGDDPASVRQGIASVVDRWADHSARALEIARSWSWADHARAVIAHG